MTDGTFQPKKNLNCIELCAGAGGMARGTHTAGFQHEKLVEWDQTSVSTLRMNAQSLLGVSKSAVLEADTRAKLIDPALHDRGWTEATVNYE